jgi:ribosomal protein S18 acetylase RimI-like enzyme
LLEVGLFDAQNGLFGAERAAGNARICVIVQQVCITVRGMSVEVMPLRNATDEIVTSLGRLVSQLSTSAPALNHDTLADVINCPTNTLLIARLDGELVGMLALVVFPIPTGIRAWIEDVAVDERSRGQGIGTALTQEAIRIALAAGARSVDLTSRPSRAAANRLYEHLGFELRDSKVYRLRNSVA